MEKVVAKDYRKGSSFQYIHGLGILDYLELKGNERILDLGCADGRLTAKIAERLPRGEVIGVDLSSDMIELAQKSYPHIRFIKQDVSYLEVGEGYDWITAQLLVHFFQDKETILKKWRKILKPSGHLLLTAGSGESPYQQLLKHLFDQPQWSSYFHLNLWGFTNLNSYIEAGEKAGFELHFVQLKSWFFEPQTQEDLKNSVIGILPMIASIPDDLLDKFLAELLAEAAQWYLLEENSYKIPIKTTIIILKNSTL